MAKTFTDKQWMGIIILITISLFALVFYMGRVPQPAEQDELKGNTQPIHSEEPSEGFHNYGFNFKGDCQGRTSWDRFNPLKYTFNSLPYFRKFPYFNYYNSPQIIGCGGRRIPCDTRHAIPNVLDPIDVSNRNIAPITVHVDDNLDMKLQKVGTIYKIFGNENQVFPLYGRKLYYNNEKWEYFTRMGPTGEFLRVFQHREYEELGNNDEVQIEGRCGKYRVSIYDRYMPQYMPFI